MAGKRIALEGLPSDSRPREKLLQRGPAALSDAELLALLLRTGIQGKNVLLLAQDIARQGTFFPENKLLDTELPAVPSPDISR